MNYKFLSCQNPVRRVEWYQRFMPVTYEFLTWQAWLTVNSTIEDAEKRVANVEAILEGFDSRILLFHDILNQMLNEITIRR